MINMILQELIMGVFLGLGAYSIYRFSPFSRWWSLSLGYLSAALLASMAAGFFFGLTGFDCISISVLPWPYKLAAYAISISAFLGTFLGLAWLSPLKDRKLSSPASS